MLRCRSCWLGLSSMSFSFSALPEIGCNRIANGLSVTIGKRITPHASTRSMPGNHHYCFVDFSTPQEAQRAVAALSGLQVPGGQLRVSAARGKHDPVVPAHPGVNSWHPHNASGEADGVPSKEGQEGQERQERKPVNIERQRAIMAASSWRSGGAKVNVA